jgi:hypothetical protein
MRVQVLIWLRQRVATPTSHATIASDPIIA